MGSRSEALSIAAECAAFRPATPVGMERFELSASCSQSMTRGLTRLHAAVMGCSSCAGRPFSRPRVLHSAALGCTGLQLGRCTQRSVGRGRLPPTGRSHLCLASTSPEGNGNAIRSLAPTTDFSANVNLVANQRMCPSGLHLTVDTA